MITLRSLVGILLLLGLSLLLTSCFRETTNQTITLLPIKVATFQSQIVENFGVCGPGLDRRGTKAEMWHQLTIRREVFRPLPFLVGWEVAVQRGESCHLRVISKFQTAIAFDLSTLPSDVVVSARLLLRNQYWIGVDTALPQGSNEACTHLYFGKSLATFEDGIFASLEDRNREIRDARTTNLQPWSRMTRDTGPYNTRTVRGPRVIPSSIDVSMEVSRWALKARPNHGFIISSSDSDVERLGRAVDERGYFCTAFLSNFSLEVTVAVPR